MALNESKFRISIHTDYDGKGAASAGEDVKKIGEHAEKGELNIRALHRALSALGPEFGEIGELLHQAEFGGALVGLLGVGIAVQKLVEQFKALREQMEAAIEDSLRLKSELILAMDAAHDRVTAYAAEIRRHQQEAREDFSREKKEMEERIKLLDAQAAAGKSIAEAKEREAEAQIKLQQAMGHVTEPEAARQIAAAKQAAADAEQAAREGVEQAKIGEQVGQLNRDKATLRTISGEPDRLNKSREAGIAQIELLDTQIKRQEKVAEEATKAAAAAKAEYDSPSANIMNIGKLPSVVDAENKAKMLEADRIAAQADEGLRGMIGTKARLEEEQKETEAKITRLNTHIDELTHSIDEAQRAIGSAANVFAANHDAYQSVRAANIHAGEIERLGDAGIGEAGLGKAATAADIARYRGQASKIVSDFDFGQRTHQHTAYTRDDLNLLARLIDIINGLVQNQNTSPADAASLRALAAQVTRVETNTSRGFQSQ